MNQFFLFQKISDFFGFTNTRQPGTETVERYIDPAFYSQTLGEKETYITWSSTARPNQQGFDAKLTRTFLIIGIVVALVLVILQEYFLIFVVASLVFVTHALSKTPPETTHYEISSHGIAFDNQIFYWPEFKRFFFVEENGLSTLALDLTSGVPPRMFLNINAFDKEKLKGILSKKLHYLEIAPQSILDKTYKSMVGKLGA